MSIEQILNFKLVTPRIASSGQPEADAFHEIQQAGYQTVINLGMPDHPKAVAYEAARVEALNMRYFALPVPFDNPQTLHLKQFYQLMQSAESDKVWVHCIMNYRVSVFLYHYLQAVTGLNAQQAKGAVFTDWQANAVWQKAWQWPNIL